MGSIKKTKYLGVKMNTKENTSPDDFSLDGVKNPHSDKDYVIRFSSPEFTSIFTITSQPDFGCIIVDYVPSKLILESKSFKLFLFSFRNYVDFMRIVL